MGSKTPAPLGDRVAAVCGGLQLRRSPLGAHGEVREVALSMRDGQYIRLGVVARMRVDAEHGVLVWTDS